MTDRPQRLSAVESLSGAGRRKAPAPAPAAPAPKRRAAEEARIPPDLLAGFENQLARLAEQETIREIRDELATFYARALNNASLLEKMGGKSGHWRRESSD